MPQKATEDFASAAAKMDDLNYTRSNSSTLRLYVGDGFHYYNFVMRALVSSTSNNEGGVTITPFSQLDRESLGFMRDKLIELGGTPPALPAEKEELPVLKFRIPTP